MTMIPYPPYPTDEISLLLSMATTRPAPAQVVHAAYELLGYGLGFVLPIASLPPGTMAATALSRRSYNFSAGSPDSVGTLIDLKTVSDHHKMIASGQATPPLSGSWLSEAWHRIVFWCQQLIGQWLGQSSGAAPAPAGAPS